MRTSTAPILLFVYNRPDHTRQTLQALQNNRLAAASTLYIYSDAAKHQSDRAMVDEVRAICSEQWAFKSVELILRERNYGLARSIIEGVSEVVSKYGRVIVFEDDLESSPYALDYFNEALEFYEQESRVMHISGYMYPLKEASSLPDTFFFRVPSSWGWATWKEAWQHFNADIDALTRDFDEEMIYRFSIDGTENYWKQVKEFEAGKINSWAIRWYLSMFRKDGLALYPRASYVQNIGTDGSGTHSDVEDTYRVELSQRATIKFEPVIEESSVAYALIKDFYAHRKGSLFARGWRFLKKKCRQVKR